MTSARLFWDSLICRSKFDAKISTITKYSYLLGDKFCSKLTALTARYCRTPFSEIAKKLGIGESTVRYRVGRLRREGIITSFTALLDPRKIGLKITAIVLVKLDVKYVAESSKKLAAFKETHHLLQSTGEYDLMSVVHARDMLHLNELTRRIKLLPGVREASVFVATRLIKVEPKFDLRV